MRAIDKLRAWADAQGYEFQDAEGVLYIYRACASTVWLGRGRLCVATRQVKSLPKDFQDKIRELFPVSEPKALKAAQPKAKKAPKVTAKEPSVRVVDYSEKCVAVQGDTRPIKDILKGRGMKFCPYLKGGAGWVAAKSHKEAIIAALGL